MKKEKDGVIYILTNPSFPEYVKIGYAANVQERLKSLNRSECIPFAFRVYATYEVSVRLGDKVLHSLIDRLNPGLRTIETFDGKTRTKEFYAMAPEDAYALLESIATISRLQYQNALFLTRINHPRRDSSSPQKKGNIRRTNPTYCCSHVSDQPPTISPDGAV